MKKFFQCFATFILLFTLNAKECIPQNWYPLGTGLSWGTSATGITVFALKVFNNELIAGGNFNTAGGVTVSNIAKWNGTSWSPLSAGYISNYVYVLENLNNQLIAGGRFTYIAGVNINSIAKWNGTSWTSLSSGMTGGGSLNGVYAIAIYNNNLIAGGNFTNAGGVSVNNIAKWDGTSWSTLGGGILGGSTGYGYIKINAMFVYNNELYVGGCFDTAGGVNAKNIAKWNGSTWSAVGSGADLFVQAFTIYNNELIVGGSFDIVGGLATSGIAKWNGSSWSTLGSGTSGFFNDVHSLYVYNSELIAGGNFTIIGGINANRIAKWNGSSWSALGTGVSLSYSPDIPDVCALTKYSNDLIVGGEFLSAGIYTTYNIAKWGMTFGIKQISSEIPDKYSLKQNYPNPFNPTTNIKYQITNNSFVSLKIFDMLGKEVAILVNEKQSPGTYEVNWNTRQSGSATLPSGVYFYSLITDNYIDTKKMLMIK
jgi:trimeric autotransporter adhesin